MLLFSDVSVMSRRLETTVERCSKCFYCWWKFTLVTQRLSVDCFQWMLLVFFPTKQPLIQPYARFRTRLVTVPQTHPGLSHFTAFIQGYFLLPNLQDLVQVAILCFLFLRILKSFQIFFLHLFFTAFFVFYN